MFLQFIEKITDHITTQTAPPYKCIVYFFRLTPKKALTYLAPCTMQFSGLMKIAEAMTHTAFNSTLKSCTRLLGLQGLLKLYKNKDFLTKKSVELEKEIAEEILKVCVDTSSFQGYYVRNFSSPAGMRHQIHDYVLQPHVGKLIFRDQEPTSVD